MKRAIAFLLAFCAVAMVSNAQNGPVKIWEGTLEIPSYRVDAPETAPSFEREFGYQGARRGIYPYALNDNLTNIKVDTVYRALYLENDYIKVCVLPDIGGRLFNDSPNRNSILHWNNVATHTNNDYQIIFPENTEFGTYHSKRSFLRWPVPDAPYRGEEGFIGKDVSYWRNLPTLKGESVFTDYVQNFFGSGARDYPKDVNSRAY